MTAATTRSRLASAFDNLSWIAPDTHALLQVNRSSLHFGSSATSKISLPAGALFARITTATHAPRQTYSSVQVGRDAHVELNSDIVFFNHSCAPSLEFDMVEFEMRVVKERVLPEGDELSFFYPSTDWRMAQPFDCWCGAPNGMYLGRIERAERLDKAVLSRYWLNEHVEEMLTAREEAVR